MSLLGAVLVFPYAPCFADDASPADNQIDPGITNIAPYLLPGLIPDQGKWVKIAQLSGDHGKNTSPVNITERRWRVTWECRKLDKKSPASLAVTAQPDRSQIMPDSGQAVCTIDREGRDTTELRGAGAYLFAVKGLCRWSLIVEQYIPTDEERAIIEARDEAAQDWQDLGEYDGSGEQDTAAFTVTQNRWRVKWSAEAPPGWSNDSLGFHVALYRQDGQLLSEVCDSTEAAHDAKEFFGPGSYFLRISGQSKWNLVVQQTDK